MKADGWWLTAEPSIRGGTSACERAWCGRCSAVGAGSPAAGRASGARCCGASAHDHHASHSDVLNQLLHIVSSSAFLVCYALVFRDLTAAMWAGLAALFLRQFGHAVLEPPCHDKEATLLGYNTRNKTLILGVYFLIPLAQLARVRVGRSEAVRPMPAPIAQEWFGWTVAVVPAGSPISRGAHGARLALVWFVKLVTDPVTDIIAYLPATCAVRRRVPSRSARLWELPRRRRAPWASSACATCGSRGARDIPPRLRAAGRSAWLGSRSPWCGRSLRLQGASDLGVRGWCYSSGRIAHAGASRSPSVWRWRGSCTDPHRSDPERGCLLSARHRRVFFGDQLGTRFRGAASFPFPGSLIPSTSGRCCRSGACS